MPWFYITALLFSIAGLLVIDYRYRLAFWFDRKRTAIVLSIAIAFFLLWDFAGIALGIFFTGSSPYVLNVLIAPELPIEEIFFLFFIVLYNAYFLAMVFTMMWTYIVLNTVFIAAMLIVVLGKFLRMPKKPIVLTLLVLVTLTAVFDSLIIWADIVAYDVTKSVGVYIGYAPIEDFAYTIAGIVLIPYLWERLKKHE